MEANAMDKLSEKVRLSVSIIGVGNAGGQVINTLANDYPVFAINSSQKDLDNRVMTEKIPAFIIGDEARGAGKNRELAQILLKKNGRSLFERQEFTSLIDESDVIFVVGAMAGGTGSGIAPVLCSMLAEMYPKKVISYFGILPKKSDSWQAQANTLQCYDEIVKIGIPYMLADLDHFNDQSNEKAYTEIAKHIGKGIAAVSGKYLNYSSSGMIDENDMRVIISEPGYMAVYMVDNLTQSDVDKKSVQQYLIDQVKSSPAAPIARDGAIRQMGMITNCSEDMLDSTKTGNYEEITEYIGRPYAIFENYSTNSGSIGQFIMILSGMSDPDPRLLVCKQIVDNKPKERKVSSVLGDTSQYKSNVNLDKLLSGDNQKEEDSVQNTKDSVLDKFFN